MKKLLIITFILTISLTFLPSASAQIINTTPLEDTTELVTGEANLRMVSIGSLIATMIQAILGLLAAVFLILIIMAGIKWMTAEGNEEQIAQARKNIKSAIIGLIIVLAAYSITYFIFKALPFGGPVSTGLTGSP